MPLNVYYFSSSFLNGLEEKGGLVSEGYGEDDFSKMEGEEDGYDEDDDENSRQSVGTSSVLLTAAVYIFQQHFSLNCLFG